MAASLKPISDVCEDSEFQLTAVRQGPAGEEYVTGFVKSFAVALQRARTLANVGWRVTVDPADPHDVETVRVIVEPVR